MMKRFALFPLLGLTLCTLAHAQVPKLPEKLDGSLDTSPETASALFMMSLYDQKLAGGDTGICLDFSNADGKSEIKIGMNTSAFVIGKSELKDTQVDAARMKNLLHALSAAQGGPIEASVDGYADGRHYQNASSLDDSIGRNRTLSKDRAQTIANLFKSDSSVKIQSTNGFPSDQLERTYPDMANGLECGTRRKVVLNIKAKENPIKTEGSGRFHFTPASYSDDMRDKSRSVAWGAVANISYDFEKKYGKRKNSPAYDADKIYAELMSTQKISPACDQFPLKQLTIAMIKSRVDNSSRGDNTFEDYLDVQGKAGQHYIEDPATGKRMNLVDYGQGMPNVIFACFRSDPKWDEALKTFNKQTGGGVFVSGSELLKATGGSNFSDNSPVQVGFDPAQMTEEKVTGDHNFGSTRVGKKERGFFCKACGHGFFFEETKDPSGKSVFNPVYDDRILKLSLTDPSNPLADALNNLSKSDPMALGSNLKPRMYVVKNCSGCGCDPLAAIRAQGSNVITIDPLAEGAKSDYEANMNKKDMDSACVIRPPLWHTCGVNPNQVKATKYDDFKGSLKYVDPVTGVQDTVKDLGELVKKIGSRSLASCSVALSPQDKINSVACSGKDRAKHLPSEDEKADCADEIKARAGAATSAKQ